MHILTTTSASLDDLVEPVDLRQTPADIVALSFTDSDLAGLAAAWKADAEHLPSMRLAALRDLRHPMSVDLWIDSVAAHAKVILVRILGGYDWWRYGCDRLAAIAREKSIKLALLPGECRDEDLRLIECSTLPRAELDALLGYFREGGPENMRGLVRRLAALAGGETAKMRRCQCRRRGFMSRRCGEMVDDVPSPLRGGWRRQGDGGGDGSARFCAAPLRPFGDDPPRKGRVRRPRHPHPLLPFHAARRRCRPHRRVVRRAARARAWPPSRSSSQA